MVGSTDPLFVFVLCVFKPFAMSANIRLTPLMGGKEAGGVCSLLEIGGARVLLDCGCTLTTSNETLLEVAEKLRAGGGVDCVLLSHADVSAFFRL